MQLMMADQPTDNFLDVVDLLDNSHSRGRAPWMWYALGGLLIMVMLGSYATSRLANGQQIMELIAGVGMFGLVLTLGLLTWNAARSVQREQQHIEAAEELIQLRRWSEAAVLLRGLLSRPMRTEQGRIQALVFLAALLARFHRFADAVTVYDHLLDMGVLDDESSYGLRLGRAMALLQDERLVDADRAINELRRARQGKMSGGLALVEICRDVKTGHAQEAIDLFRENLGAMRQQLGHRVADAYALIARAHDMLGHEADARQSYESATLLAPEIELHRRYPEVHALSGKYPPVPMPVEVA